LEDFLGIAITEHIAQFDVAPRSVASQPLPQSIVTPLVEARNEMIVARGPEPALWFFGPDKWLRYSGTRAMPELESDGEEHRLTLRSRHLLRDVIIAVDRLDPDATIDDNCFTILPNEPKRVTIRSKRKLRVEELTSPPVFQNANRFGAFPMD
jgi:beta-mannosidase